MLVFIKQIELKRFKSFGSTKVVFNLDRGLTIITGPNGSGKSNLLDAVRFALGDLRVRSLRASKMSEVIFDGTPTLKASKNAYVKIRFDNSDRTIPIDKDGISLSRTVNRKGFSKYQLNGRTISRSQIVDILGMAGIYSSGYNMVMQGTITKLAEINPYERRKIIEDFIGIAEYNAKKSEAKTQLKQAETNLRIADARLGDVQYRLENLEEERNNALRYNFIREETAKLHAIVKSHKILKIENEKETISKKLQKTLTEAKKFKKQINNLQHKKNEIESARRTFNEEVADKGSLQLFTLQKSIGEIMVNISSLKTEIDSGKRNLKRLTKLHKERVKQHDSLINEIKKSSNNLHALKTQATKLKKELEEKQSKHINFSNELNELKQNIGVSTTKLTEIEKKIGNLLTQNLQLKTKLNTNLFKQRMLSKSLKNLKERSSNFEPMLTDFASHINELQKLQTKEKESLLKISHSLKTTSTRKNNLLQEIQFAEKTAKTARSAIIEFEAQKDVIEKFVTEEYALQRIEEMGVVGAIPGVFGRLQNLIKINSKYEKAVIAAASGWLKAVVVKDLITALKCVESLKKMKIGRIKLIPLKEVKEVNVKTLPDIKGVIGLASDLLQYNKKYEGAINFIFGDTIVTSGEKSAFLVSQAGFRVVDLNGGLYEAGGGIENGYYRSQVDFSSLVSNEIAIKNLTKSFESLEHILTKRKDDLESINQDFLSEQEERVKRFDIIKMITRDIEVIHKNIDRTKNNIRVLNKRIKRLHRSIAKAQTFQTQLLTQRDTYQKSLKKLRSQKKKTELSLDSSALSTYEKDQIQINSEITELNLRFLKIQNEIDTLETNLETTIKPEHKRVKVDLKNLTSQIKLINENILEAQTNLNIATPQLAELEKSKEALSETLASVIEKRKSFVNQVDEVDFYIRKITLKYEPLRNNAHQMDLDLQKKTLECKALKNELLQLGFEKPLPVKDKDISKIKSSIELMNYESEQLGSVNLLAPTQYGEQQKKYKQLSIRRNQLEKERKAILSFIEEIERKKKEAFLEAYHKVNKNFSVFFEKLTGGGTGSLRLEKPEDPFSGGLDIFLQFPGKSERLIAGASGGEKSVVAVAFIFAIQSLSPASFYIFDEIDAHLDPYNAERLASLLKERSRYSQFIVITLRDVIIKRATKIFGVYVYNGVSQLVSTQIVEATI